jgi:hypothetical protein
MASINGGSRIEEQTSPLHLSDGTVYLLALDKLSH